LGREKKVDKGTFYWNRDKKKNPQPTFGGGTLKGPTHYKVMQKRSGSGMKRGEPTGSLDQGRKGGRKNKKRRSHFHNSDKRTVKVSVN